MENPGCHIPIQQHHSHHHHQQSQQQHFNQKAQSLVLDGDVFQRWSQIGTSQGFTTDTDIARFLIQHYESTWDRVQPSVYCVNCHNPMSLACTKCDSAMLQSSSLQVSPDGSSSTFVTPPSVDRDPSVRKRGSSKTTKKTNSKKGKLAATSESNMQENDEDLAGLCIQFEQPSSYSDHIVFPCPDAKRSDIKSYLCTRCGKTFFKSSDLKKHVRIHTHEKPYKCDRCPSAFSDPSSYSRHKRVHTGEKPFVCQECNTGFAQSSDLTKHIRIHTRERPLRCQFCSDCFSDPSSFARHRRKHQPT